MRTPEMVGVLLFHPRLGRPLAVLGQALNIDIAGAKRYLSTSRLIEIATAPKQSLLLSTETGSKYLLTPL